MDGIEITPQFKRVLDTMVAIGQAGWDGLQGPDAIGALLGITPDETMALCRAVAEAVREAFPDRDPAMSGFAMGLRIGERIGFGRGMEQVMG